MKIPAPTRRSCIRFVCLISLFAFAAAASITTLHAQGSAIRVETFSLRPNGRVIVENSRGAINVESWQNQAVRVVAEKKTPAAGSIDPGELVLMGAQNSIIVQCKAGTGRIDLTLYVPADSSVQLTSGAWPIEVAGSLQGAVIETTSGNISYRMPSNEDARVSMRSSQGTVRSTVPLTSVQRIGVRSFRGLLGTGAAEVILNSQNGNITLAPAPPVAKVSNRENIVTAASEMSSAAGASPAGAEPRRNPPVEQHNASGNDSSFVFAGADRSDDSSMTTSRRPLMRPPPQRDTTASGSGLKVRIIPSNAPPNASRNDQSQENVDATKPGPSTGNAPGAATPNAGGGSVVFAGSDRADNGTSKARVGPLERERTAKNTSGG